MTAFEPEESQVLFFSGGLGLLFIALWIFCVVDTIVTPADQVRTLPKLAWIFIVILLADVGAIAWLVAGRPWAKVPAGVGARTAHSAGPRARPTNPDDDEEFLAGLRLRAEEQRRRAREKGDDESPSE